MCKRELMDSEAYRVVLRSFDLARGIEEGSIELLKAFLECPYEDLVKGESKSINGKE